MIGDVLSVASYVLCATHFPQCDLCGKHRKRGVSTRALGSHLGKRKVHESNGVFKGLCGLRDRSRKV